MVNHSVVRELADWLIGDKHIAKYTVAHLAGFNLNMMPVFNKQEHTVQIGDDGNDTSYDFGLSATAHLEPNTKATFQCNAPHILM